MPVFEYDWYVQQAISAAPPQKEPAIQGIPCTTTSTDWGGGKTPAARVRCITCGTGYTVDPAYNLYAPCPFCKSTVIKAVLV